MTPRVAARGIPKPNDTMSRYALTVAWPHGGGPAVILKSNELAPHEHFDEFVKLPEFVHDKWDSVDVLFSDSGIQMQRQFITPAEDQRRKKAHAKQVEEFERRRKEELRKEAEAKGEKFFDDEETEVAADEAAADETKRKKK